MTELFQAMGQMDNMTIGLWITGLMLVLVILGLRVAFAAAVAGVATKAPPLCTIFISVRCVKMTPVLMVKAP